MEEKVYFKYINSEGRECYFTDRTVSYLSHSSFKERIGWEEPDFYVEDSESPKNKVDVYLLMNCHMDNNNLVITLTPSDYEDILGVMTVEKPITEIEKVFKLSQECLFNVYDLKQVVLSTALADVSYDIKGKLNEQGLTVIGI